MKTINQNLNLSRKWRPRTFKEIIGQETSIKMLQNSLYLEKIFPVYLFAGQRGCGKTSTARVFSAALNCENLDKFRKTPAKNPIPCLECQSCKSMQSANHPDFIEIDAASHTGVENVRQILEACSYMPILGKKKIYLIDEAHMLSKAAFNAFLKILEEPPPSVCFILATTEMHKFPQTVLSRCFQVIFKAIENNLLKKHLMSICIEEKINIEQDALDTIVQEKEGCARDAINLLEQIRFFQKKITSDVITKILGKVSEKELFDLFEVALDQDTKKLLGIWNSIEKNNVDAQILWNMLVQLIRTILWIKFGSDTLPTYFNDVSRLKKIAQKTSTNRLNSIFQLFWSQENIFLKTPQKRIFLETVLMQICQQVNVVDLEDIVKEISTLKTLPVTSVPSTQNNHKGPSETQKEAKPFAKNILTKQESPNKNLEETAPWESFLSEINNLNNPFIKSVFTQARFQRFDQEKKLVEIILKNNNSFVQDTIKEHEQGWLPILKKHFPKTNGFGLASKQGAPNLDNKSMEQSSKTKTEAFAQEKRPTHSAQTTQQSWKPTKNTLSKGFLDISDKKKWPMANLLIKHFPGKIRLKN